ncbi:MAG: prolipoprotein diacylglyceryl transferase [Candidatus Acetothermia bacterium]
MVDLQPIAFRAGPLTVRWYGIAYAVALLASLGVLYGESRRKSLELDMGDLIDFSLLAFPLGLLGARLYYAAFHLSYFVEHPLALAGFGPDGYGLAGLGVHGGLLGGAVGLAIYVKWKDVPLLDFLDAVAPAILLAQAIGRLGNFMNGDAHGYPTKAPWGVEFSRNTAAGAEFPGQKLHPTMLYELLLNLVVFFLLWRLRDRGFKKGFVFLLYLVLYSVVRSAVSFFRAGSLWVGPIRAAHLISIPVVFVSLYLIISKKLYRREQ